MVIVSGVVGAWLAKQSYRGVISKIRDRVGHIPPCRRWYKTRITNWAKRNFKFEMVQMPANPSAPADPNTVDGEVLNKPTPDSSGNGVA